MRLTAAGDKEVGQFFEKLYAKADSGRLEVRCLGETKAATSAWFPITAQGFGAALVYARSRNQQDAYDVFFGVNPRVHGGQDDESVLAGVALWADIDGLGTPEAAEDALAKSLEFPLKVNAAVFSGNGLHLYSVLREPIDPAGEDWSCYCRAIRSYAEQFGGDPKCTNPSRVLRFPGMYSHKRQRDTLLWLGFE